MADNDPLLAVFPRTMNVRLTDDGGVVVVVADGDAVERRLV